MLLTDTNVLRRVCLGAAMQHVDGLRRRGVDLATTSHNAFELRQQLLEQGLAEASADEMVGWALAPFELLLPQEYQHLQTAADRRLREGGKSDWPLLAAAIATGEHIWSDDRDFFGTGVPVWTTDNVRFVERN